MCENSTGKDWGDGSREFRCDWCKCNFPASLENLGTGGQGRIKPAMRKSWKHQTSEEGCKIKFGDPKWPFRKHPWPYYCPVCRMIYGCALLDFVLAEWLAVLEYDPGADPRLVECAVSDAILSSNSWSKAAQVLRIRQETLLEKVRGFIPREIFDSSPRSMPDQIYVHCKPTNKEFFQQMKRFLTPIANTRSEQLAEKKMLLKMVQNFRFAPDGTLRVIPRKDKRAWTKTTIRRGRRALKVEGERLRENIDLEVLNHDYIESLRCFFFSRAHPNPVVRKLLADQAR